MNNQCEGTFVGYSDGGGYVRIRYRCFLDRTYHELAVGSKFCPNCGKPIPEDVETTNPPARFVAQVRIGDEWETVE